MPQQSQLYIVASRHPRVGKTLLARLLIEFQRISGRPLVGYDLDPREPTFAGCFPNLVWPVDIAATRGQMSLFDRILADHWRTTVIDLGYGLFDQFFKVMAEIGFEEEARQRSIQPTVLIITDSAPVTAQLTPSCGGVCNRPFSCPYTEAASFMVIAQDFPPSSPKYEMIRIPRLSAIVRRVIDRPGFSFSAYMSQQPGGPTEVHSWINQIFGEFRELELQLLIGELESSLRGGGKGQVRQIPKQSIIVLP